MLYLVESCLNPCCAGRCSSTRWRWMCLPLGRCSLNPCCAGRCSSTSTDQNWYRRDDRVSILVVLDDALVQELGIRGRVSKWTVSILVVLDDALVRYRRYLSLTGPNRLNPCCAGRCSSTTLSMLVLSLWLVSILVVLDDALVLDVRH